ncbi:helix-turn-helix domain-containing protein [Nocardia sp. NPDC057227]|uniref:helix-turn-helix domain-containing protein n=1 Tax=Nocardia sp. NPDC057227 TaxID=3346056 RepID=UPI003631F827
MTAIEEVGSVQLGRRLTQLREQAGWKQADLAKQVTWSATMLSRIESGDRTVSEDELNALLAAIGTDDANLLAEALGRTWSILPRPALNHSDQNLLWEADQVASSLSELTIQPNIRPAFERRLREYVEEIRNTAALLLRRQHDIAFIGSIGIGKSTALCKATALEVFTPLGIAQPVLETGAGGITLCEVHLRIGPGFGVVVEPRTHDDIRVDVEDFADQLISTRGKGTEGNEKVEFRQAVPREIERAIRNMTALQTTRTKGADGKTHRSDPAKALAESAPSKRELVVEVLTRMALHTRDRRDVWFDTNDASEPLEWLKQTFEQINNGRHPEFSLPRRIDLVVPQLFDETTGLTVNAIDTRGIDQPTARGDLEAHLEDPHTVTVLCSGFNDAPEQSIHHLIERASEIGNPQISTHCSILVLARSGEALAVKDEAGIPVDTADEGYDLKGEQIENALSRYDLSELPTFFYNAKEEDPARLRKFLLGRVADTRDEFRRKLTALLENARNLIDNAEQEQVREVQRAASHHVRIWIEENQQTTRRSGHIEDSLLKEVAAAHASSVHAAARRFGEWRSLSYGHQLGYGARRLAVLTLRDSVKGFDTICGTLSKSMPEAEELLTHAARLMAHTYEDLLKKMQVSGTALYRGQLQNDVELWNTCIDAWGQGSGYRDTVTQLSKAWFQDPNRRALEAELWATIDREWATLLQRVEAIFETD